jgi:exonuclease SbcD
MIRVLHFADLHLGVENYGRLDASTGLHSRLVDFLRSFDELVDYALAEAVDLVLFAGDAYKNRDPNPTHQREFATRIQRLVSADIPVFLLVGNHDIQRTAGRANTLDIFSTLEVPLVHVGRRPGLHHISTRSGPVQILALPWIVRSHLLSREEFKNRSLVEIEELTLSKLENILQQTIKKLDPDVPTILAVHGSVHGAEYGSERSVMLGQELVLPRSLLYNPAFDYVALGHIHRHQVIGDGQPPMVYSGSVDRIDFGEEKEAKGFVVAEVTRGDTPYRFVKLTTTRRFITIEAQANGADPMAQVSEAIAAHNIDDAIVRLIIHTTMEKNRLLEDREIYQLLGGAFRVATVVRDVERVSRLRLGQDQTIERMSPRELLDRYFRMSEVPQPRIEKLLEYAQRVMDAEL